MSTIINWPVAPDSDPVAPFASVATLSKAELRSHARSASTPLLPYSLFPSEKAASTPSLYSTPSPGCRGGSHKLRLKIASVFLFVAGYGLFYSYPLRTGTNDLTIGILELASNDLLEKAAHTCKWAKMHRGSTEAYGPRLASPAPGYPYLLTQQDQFRVDDIIRSSIASSSYYRPLAPVGRGPDFWLLPIYGQLLANPWNCKEEELFAAINSTIHTTRQLIAVAAPTSYPRFILPLAVVRSSLESSLLVEELAREFGDGVIVVSIEGASRLVSSGQDWLKYVIDVPYPTRFHLPAFASMRDVGEYFLNRDRPFLLHYAGAATHTWGTNSSDLMNGFPLRKSLQDQLAAAASLSTSPRISYLPFSNAVDGQQDLEAVYDAVSSSIFCLQPPGDTPTRRGFYDSIQLGCIPVIFRAHSYGRLFPSSSDFDAELFTILIDEEEITRGKGETIIERLEKIPAPRIREMQLHIQRIAGKSQWSLPMFISSNGTQQWAKSQVGKSSDAFGMLIKELETIKRGSWKARSGIVDWRAS